jgi:hypothetical protein
MRKTLRFVVTALNVVITISLGAQPPLRAHHALVYDAGAKRVLLTAGSTPVDGGNSFTFFNDLWAWDGTRWTALAPSGAQISGVALAYDTQRRQVVSFGGYRGSALGELRVLTNNTWQTVGAHPSIVAAEPGFVYDSKRDRFVLLGGSAGRGQAHGETWEYAGGQWTRRDVPGPQPRQGHVMVFDAARGRTVVFGGSGAPVDGRPQLLGDVWEFDGNTWQQRSGTGPAPRAAAGAAFDSKRGRVIIFGGNTSTGFVNDTWAWDGNAWTKLSDTGPEARAMGYLAYDQERDRVVLFGGRKGWPNDLNDTWEFDGTSWTRR